MSRSDPAGDKFHRPIHIADTWSEILFYGSAALSVLALLISRKDNGFVYDLVQIGFVLAVVVNGIIGFAMKLYFFPRAAEKRRQDLLSNSFYVNLTHDNSVGYFNNDQTNPLKRLAASTMESAFFTAAIAKEMLGFERARMVIYLCVWIIAVSIRSTDLGLVSVAAQVLFGEQVLSKWLRLEWLRSRSERVYERIHRLVTTASTFNKSNSHAQVLEYFADYEAAKATATVSMSGRVFNNKNAELSAEWDRIRAGLSL